MAKDTSNHVDAPKDILGPDDQDLFQDSFNLDIEQLPGNNTLMMMEEFTLNSTSDIQKKLSPGFISAKTLLDQNSSKKLSEEQKSENKHSQIKHLNHKTNEMKKNSTKCLKVKSKNIKHEVCLDKKENDHIQNIVSDKTLKRDQNILQKFKGTIEIKTDEIKPCDNSKKTRFSPEKIKSSPSKNEKEKTEKEVSSNSETSNCLDISNTAKELANCLNVSDTAKELANCLNVSDTAKELANCLNVSDTAKELANCLNVSDTAKELANCLNVSDTAKELANSLNVSDTAKELANWGLPQSILEKYKEKGISTMFDWQVECLLVDGVLEGRNLVYSAPTSAGKTLVAEILMIKRVVETGKKAILILPFVSLAREKMFHLQSILGETGVRVEGFMGSISPAGGIKVADIAVATIEKANGIINRLLEDGELGKVGCVVVDELHLLGDPSRGYLLELLLTKIRFMSSSPGTENSVQIIGMSATLPNLSDLSHWLEAGLYTSTFRPVPLTELVKIGSTLLNKDLVPVGSIQPVVQIPNDTDHLSWLSLETVLAGHSILIFCPIKSWVEKLAESIAKDFYLVGKPAPEDTDETSCNTRLKLQNELDGSRLVEVLEQLRRCPSGLDNTLAATLRVGVGFHHAGLTTDERDVLEANFKSGIIRVLVATSTLSSGVNLPARRVILRCPLTYNGQLMDKLAYKQMVGRAGRKGVDTAGESILICKESEREKVRELVGGESEPVLSCLAGAGAKLAASMKRAILEVVVSGAATTKPEVERYASCTLLSAQLKVGQGKEEEEEKSIRSCVEFLEKNEFIRFQGGEQADRYVASRLGLACLASSLAPDEGLTVFAELTKARRQFVLENELHILYLIVPIYAAVSWPRLDWMAFLSMWEELPEDMKRVGLIVGVEERWIVRAMRGTIRSGEPSQRDALAIHQRFYTALALHDLAHEVPLSEVAAKYGATKGMLQSLQQAASTFAGMVTVFCARLGWNSLELLLGQFQDRLEFGVRRELIDLCRLTSVDGARARVLYDGGLETVALLAAADPEEVENILHSAQPFRSSIDKENSRKIRTVFISGRPPMTEVEAARIMVDEARSSLRRDLGIQAGAWIPDQVHRNQVDLNKSPAGSSSKKSSRSSSGKKRRISARRESSKRGKRSFSSERGDETTSPCVVDVSFKKPEPVSEKKEELLSTRSRKPDPVPAINTPSCTTPEPCRKSNSTERVASSIIGNKSIIISPPFQASRIPKPSPQQSCGQFDMSSILDNIFEDEMETTNVKQDEAYSGSPALRCIPDPEQKPENSPIVYLEELTLELSESDCDEPKVGSLGRQPEALGADFNLSSNSMSSWEDDIFDSSIDFNADKNNIVTSVNKYESKIEKMSLENWETFDVSPGTLSILQTHPAPVQRVEETNKPLVETKHPKQIIDLNKDEHDKNDNPTKKARTQPFLDELKVSELNSTTRLNPHPEKLSLKDRRRKAKRQKAFSPGNLIMSGSEHEDDFSFHESVSHPQTEMTKDQNFGGKIEEKTKKSPKKSDLLPDKSQELLKIIDVCSDRRIFESFVEEIKAVEMFSVAVAVERENGEKNQKMKRRRSGLEKCQVESGVVVGVAFTFSRLEAFYLALLPEQDSCQLDESLSAPSLDNDISLEEKLQFLRWLVTCKKRCRALSWRHQFSLLFSITGVNIQAVAEDPGAAAWLMDPGSTPGTLHRLVLDHVPHLIHLLQLIGSAPGVGSVSCSPTSPQPGRIRAVVESVLVLHLQDKLLTGLIEQKLEQQYLLVEMKVESILLGLELTGMGVHEQEFRDTRLLLEQRVKIIEEEAYRLAGRHFAFSSPQDICRLLYHELKLPVNGDPKLNLRQARGGRGGVRMSASKEILEKLGRDHQLPLLILEHRRISGALSRTLNPLLSACVSHSSQSSSTYPRVYPTCITYTATGRISMQEPNLQNIPRDFQVELTDDLRRRALGRRSKRRSCNISLVSNPHLEKLLEPVEPSTTVSLRNALVPGVGNLYLSADYSQLELRILAHLSQDSTLISILVEGGDVFRSLAARTNKIDVSAVTDEQRQQAKQIVYGLVYGVGPKSLAEQLKVSEAEAETFMEDFKSKYPGLRIFLNKCVATARRTGYVETISCRRRQIPDIGSTNIHRRSAAERQAVNTKVQGSAADLVKTSMVRIEERLEVMYPQRTPFKYTSRSSRSKIYGSGSWLVLQLHDELIYEVESKDILEVGRLVRECMESALPLSVPTPVRLKVGETWGNLQTFTLPD